MISHKFWDAVTLLLIFLLSLAVLFALVQLISEGRLLHGYSQMTMRVLNIVFSLTIFLIIIVLVMENGSPVRTLAWILILVYLPIIGFIFYLFFGRNWRKSRIFSQKGSEDIIHLQEHILQDNLPQGHELKASDSLTGKLINLLENNNKALLTTDNDVLIIPDTQYAFNLMLKEIKTAKEHIHIEYFSLAADEAGNEFKEALIEKAREGVKIRLIYDAVGCWKLPRKYKNSLKKEGVELYPFLPSTFPVLGSGLNYRNHRKLVIVDNQYAFLGGLNIGNKYLSRNKYFGYWRDSLLFLQGKCVLSLQAIFLTDWFFVSKQNLLRQYLTKAVPQFTKETVVPGCGIPVQIVSSGPDSDWESIMQVYFAAITNAQKSVHITSPYLVLNESLLMALKTAALSGVEVKLILPSKPDHKIVFWGSRSYYTELLRAGVEIYEYKRGFIHAKVLIVDEKIVSIGTANMDMRSFNHNFELNAMLYDKGMAALAEVQFQDDLVNSAQIVLEDFSKRPFSQKTLESVCRLFSPLL
ncbi:MAG TPA: cardiolipin synthase [Candidatus Cloacimonadota bacterium]|nr:cardiolipin synthase [Candidatus Cloacimonadota bacterium]HQL15133.1 cardiolipin synthase [Candidatus Cloacimonadota bacterium]